MNNLSFSLVILWGFIISISVLMLLIIGSTDSSCNRLEHGWDKICQDNNEYYKQRILQIAPICGIIFSALFIILIPKFKTSQQTFQKVEDKHD